MERSIKSLSRLQLNVTHSGILDQYRNRSFKNKKGRNWIISIRSITFLNNVLEDRRHDLKHDFAGEGRRWYCFCIVITTRQKNPLNVMHSWVAIEWKPFKTVHKQGSCFRVNSIKTSHHVWKLWTSASKYPSDINVRNRSWQREFIRLGGLVNKLYTAIKCKYSRLSIGFQ